MPPVVADKKPLGTPGRIDEIAETDRVVAGGIVRIAAGDLVLEDPVTGPKTLAQLASGGIGGTLGASPDVVPRSSGTGGQTLQASLLSILASGALSLVGTMADTTPLATWGESGTNGGTTHFFFGSRTPVGNVTGAPGDVYFRVSGATSNLYIHTGAASDNSSWTDMLAWLRGTLGVAPNVVAVTSGAGGKTLQASPMTVDASTGAWALTGTMSDTTALAQLGQSGTNGGVVGMFFGSRDPTNNVTGNPGDIYFRDSGTTSSLYQHRGASANTTGWVAFSTGGGTILGTVGTTDRAIVLASGTGGFTAQGSTATISAGGDVKANSVELVPVAANPGAIPANTLWIDSSGTRAKQGTNTLAYLSETGSPIIISPPTISAQQDNYNPAGFSTATHVRIALTGAQSITGFAAGAAQISKVVSNTDASVALTLPHESTSSTAVNRIICPNGVSFVVPPLSSTAIYYDPTSTRWRVVDVPAGSGEVNTASNLGAGLGAFSAKVGVDLRFNSFSSVSGISSSIVSNVITFDGTALLPRDGSRAMTAALNMAQQPVTALGYRVISDTIAATANNYSPTNWDTADEVRLTLTGNQTITGFAAPTAGGTVRKLLVVIDTVDTLSITNEAAGSTAANRALTPNASTLDVQPQGSCSIEYDATSARWRVVSVARSVLALPAAGAVLSAVRRSTGATNIAAATFIGFDTTLHTTDTVYWTFDGAGTWICQRAHEAFFDFQMSFVNGSDVNAQVTGECRVSTDGGATYVTVVQAHSGSCYSTTSIKDFIAGRCHRNWAVGDRVRLYVVPTLGNFTTVANGTCAQIVWVSG